MGAGIFPGFIGSRFAQSLKSSSGAVQPAAHCSYWNTQPFGTILVTTLGFQQNALRIWQGCQQPVVARLQGETNVPLLPLRLEMWFPMVRICAIHCDLPDCLDPMGTVSDKPSSDWPAGMA